MAKKKILFFINTLNYGGAERVVSMLASDMSRDFEVHIALYNRLVLYDIPPEVVIVDLKENPDQNNALLFFRLPVIAYKLKRYCAANGIGMVISFLNRPCYVAAFMKSWWGYKGKLIMCERSYQSQILKFIGGGSSLYRFITRRLIHFAYQQADLVITNSTLSQIDLQDNFAITTPVQVIYNPVDVALIQQKSIEEKPSLFLSSNSFFYVSVGVFRVEKNFELLLKAFSLIKDKAPVKLVIVGKGELETELKKMAGDLGISSDVFFCGFQPNPYKFIANADCFVLSSLTEGFPNVLLEALACKKTVVSTDCQSGPRELLAPSSDPSFQVQKGYEKAEYGILTPPGDPEALAEAMLKVYSDPEIRAYFESRAFERAGNFNIEICSDAYKQHMKNLAGN